MFVISVQGQELSDVIYPSEDEIRESFRQDEITWEQYLILLELIQHGVDSSNSYLLDQIPNLSFFREQTKGRSTPDEDRQGRGFRKKELSNVRGDVRLRFYRRLEEEGKYNYRVAARLKVGRHWSGAINFNRTISGREQLQSRQIKYSRTDGIVRRVWLGSFNMRLGLGAVVGYRGRILRGNDELDAESILFPSYGGHNGIGGRLRFGGWTVSGIGSMKRDSSHRLGMAGLAVERKIGKSSVGFVAALTRLKNRTSGHEYHDQKFSVHTRRTYSGGYAEIELAGQDAETGRSTALIIEGRHRFEGADIRYSGWMYGDRFIDLTSGSKVSRLSRTVTLVETDFTFASRRLGQKGGLLRLIMPINDRISINSSVLVARVEADNSLVQLACGISRDFGDRLQLRADVLQNERRLWTSSGETGPDWRRGKLGARFRTGNLDLRAYIAHTSRKESGDYWSLFCETEFDTETLGQLSVWANISRLNSESVQYAYVYVSSEIELVDHLDLKTKFAHRYSDSASERYQLTVSLELTARL